MLKWFQKNEKQTLGFQDMQYAIHHSFVIILRAPKYEPLESVLGEVKTRLQGILSR